MITKVYNLLVTKYSDPIPSSDNIYLLPSQVGQSKKSYFKILQNVTLIVHQGLYVGVLNQVHLVSKSMYLEDDLIASTVSQTLMKEK